MISPWLLRILPRSLRHRLAGRSYFLQVIDNVGWIFSERILRHGIGFAVGAWIARYVGAEQYGLLNYAMSLVLVFSFLGSLGMDAIGVRDLVRNPARVDETLGTLLFLRILGGLLMLAAVSLAVMLLMPADSRAGPIIAVISIAQFLLFTDSIDCWFQANVTSSYTVVARLASFLMATSMRVALVVFEAPLVAFALANLAESLLMVVAMGVVYRRSGQRISRLRPTITRAKELFIDGWPLFLSAAVVAVSQRLDQVLLGELASFADVGAYAIAVRVVEATYIVPTVIATSVFPAMIKQRARNPALYEVQVQRICSAMLWLGVLIAVPLSLFAGPLVHLLVGEAYAGAALPLATLAWMPVFVAFNLVRQRWLLAEQAVSVALAVEIAGCALNVVANCLLIPRYGATGAAIAALIGTIGATLAIAPFSIKIRRSLKMMLNGVAAPLAAMLRS